MGLLDAPMAKVAQTLTKKFGRAAVLVRPGSGTPNPKTGKVEAAGPDTSIPCEVVFTEFSAFQIDGTLIRAGDRKAIVSRLRIEGAVTASEPVPNRDKLTGGR